MRNKGVGRPPLTRGTGSPVDLLSFDLAAVPKHIYRETGFIPVDGGIHDCDFGGGAFGLRRLFLGPLCFSTVEAECDGLGRFVIGFGPFEVGLCRFRAG